jgi:hypothetical protein
MKYSAALLMALVIVIDVPIFEFTRFAGQSVHAEETTPRPCIKFQGEQIFPGQGFSFALGDTLGVVYYTSEPGGLRLVTTIGNTNGTPVRFVTTLAPNQTVTVSVPRQVGQEAIEVSFLRLGERLIVKSSPCTSD